MTPAAARAELEAAEQRLIQILSAADHLDTQARNLLDDVRSLRERVRRAEAATDQDAQ